MERMKIQLEGRLTNYTTKLMNTNFSSNLFDRCQLKQHGKQVDAVSYKLRRHCRKQSRQMASLSQRNASRQNDRSLINSAIKYTTFRHLLLIEVTTNDNACCHLILQDCPSSKPSSTKHRLRSRRHVYL